MSANDGAYFPFGSGMSMTQAQKEVYAQLSACISELKPDYLPPANTVVTREANGTLILTANHSRRGDLAVAITIDEDGRLDVLCECLHPTFELCFNDKWEPHDCLGDLAYGIRVIVALFEGNVESRVVYSRKGKGIAKSEDWMIDESGNRTRLYVQYHGQSIFDALFGRRCEFRRVSFLDEQGVTVSRC